MVDTQWMNDAQRDALLIRLDERTARLAKLIEGNGRPGILQDVTILKEDMRQREREADELRGAVPQLAADAKSSAQTRATWTSATVSAIIVGVITAVKAVWFT
jgi:hypothetical protein